MNKTLGRLITVTLFLLLTVGCTKSTQITTATTPTQQNTQAVSANDANQFSTISSQRTGSVEVVCHNCQAHFKLSQQIHKMSMKGDAIVDCPVCHKDYLGK